MKNITKLLMMAAVFFIAPLFLSNQAVFAGDPNCQSGYITNPYNNNPPPRRPADENREQRELAAAQLKNTQNQFPNNGIGGTGSPTNSSFSYFSSMLIVIGGLWILFVLLGQSFGLRLKQSRFKSIRFLDFAFSPAFAVSGFGILFIAVIAVNTLISPTKVEAEKRDKLNKLMMTGIDNPSNKPVFKSAQQIGGSESTQIGSPVFDAVGNRYVRGTFTQNLPIGSQTLQESKFFDLFVAKYSPDGTALWARQGIGATSEISVPGTAIEGATALTVDFNGNVYVGGSFVKKLTLQGGSNPNITLTDDNNAGLNYESFVAKYDANGNLQWARGGNSGSPKNTDNLEIGQNAIDQIALDPLGNLYVTGFVSGVRSFGSTVVNNGQTDILLAKLDQTSGAVVWQRIIGGTGDDNGLDLKTDGFDNVYLIGNYGSPSITFPNGETFGNPDDPTDTLEDSTNTFIAKFTIDGNIIWVKNLDNDDTLGGSQIAVNPAGEIFLTGYYFDSATFGTTTLTESEGSGDDEDALGGYITKLDTDGNYLWAKGFGGIGKALGLDATGRIYVVGTFWDGGTFGAGTTNEETLASFGGEDLFVARYEANGDFNWAKPIASNNFEGGTDIGNPAAADGRSENNYSPLGIAYNSARQTMFISGDFRGVLNLDCLTLKTPNDHSRHSYLAELSADNEAVSCRIWNGLDADDNNWDSPDNWNGGVIPADNNSVYVPYTGNSFDNPSYNPGGIGSILNNLTVSDDRTLTLGKDLVLTGKLWLLGGFVNTADRKIDMTDTATANRIADADGNGGYVIGKIRKEFGDTMPFTFIIGTPNGYSPVDVIPQSGSGALLSINAVEQPHPDFLSSSNRLNRYWTISRGGKGSINANLTFHYLQTDVAGNESTYKLFKIESPDPPVFQTATINTDANTATVNNVSEFSDWTLAQLAPTAANVSIGGRVTNGSKIGVANAQITLTDQNGTSKTARTNSLGNFKFNDVRAGETYIVSVNAKRFQFTPQVITATENVTDLLFSPTN